MTNPSARTIAVVIFGSLAFFYWASLVATLNMGGWLWTLNAASEERHLAYSLIVRAAGGTLCLVIICSMFGRHSGRRLGMFLAWVLAVGVALIVLLDILSQGSVPLLVWAIAVAAIALHLYGAVYAQRVARHEAF